MWFTEVRRRRPVPGWERLVRLVLHSGRNVCQQPVLELGHIMFEEIRLSQLETRSVTALLDKNPFGALQWRVVLLCGGVAMLDGMDLQSIGLAAPSLAKALRIDPHAFGFVFSAALLGLMVGSALLGPLADRVGRRRVLILSTAMFGLFTVLTAFAQDLTSLLLIRFLTGLGLGGATPSFVSLTSEYTPRRLRRFVVALLWAGIPLGGALGGVLASQIIPSFGWRALFFVGGGLPLGLSVGLLLFLPESVSFLVTSRAGADRVYRILRRIAPGEPRQQHYVLGEPKLDGTPVMQLFAEGRGFGTVLLWGLFFLIFLVLVTNTAWSPTLLSMSGLTPAQIGLTMAASNGGAVLGGLVIGLLIQRDSPYQVLTAALVAGGLCFTLFGLVLPSFGLVSLLQGTVQLLIGGSGAGVVAVAAMLYPTSARSTGIGWATGFGRLGSFLGPLAAGALIAAHVSIGVVYATLGVLGMVTAVFVLMLGREQHCRRASARIASG